MCWPTAVGGSPGARLGHRLDLGSPRRATDPVLPATSPEALSVRPIRAHLCLRQRHGAVATRTHRRRAGRRRSPRIALRTSGLLQGRLPTAQGQLHHSRGHDSRRVRTSGSRSSACAKVAAPLYLGDLGVAATDGVAERPVRHSAERERTGTPSHARMPAHIAAGAVRRRPDEK